MRISLAVDDETVIEPRLRFALPDVGTLINITVEPLKKS